jgi:hypothetical protein
VTNQLFVKRLTASDAIDVQACFDSQPKVMMAVKQPGRDPYAGTFTNLLRSGCVAYGALSGDLVQAFTIVWPWPSLPASTIVMGCNRPTGGIYSPRKSGFQATFDACLLEMESDQRRLTYHVRSSGTAWKDSTLAKGVGRFEHYRRTVAEQIPAGSLSRYSDFNRFILGSRPVSANAVIIAAVAPMDGDF